MGARGGGGGGGGLRPEKLRIYSLTVTAKILNYRSLYPTSRSENARLHSFNKYLRWFTTPRVYCRILERMRTSLLLKLEIYQSLCERGIDIEIKIYELYEKQKHKNSLDSNENIVNEVVKLLL